MQTILLQPVCLCYSFSTLYFLGVSLSYFVFLFVIDLYRYFMGLDLVSCNNLVLILKYVPFYYLIEYSSMPCAVYI